MSEQPYAWYVGIDWASESHQVWLLDGAGTRAGERAFEHSGPGLAALADWLLEVAGAGPEHIAVAIEVPRGAVVETLVEAGVRRIRPQSQAAGPVPRSPHGGGRQG